MASPSIWPFLKRIDKWLGDKLTTVSHFRLAWGNDASQLQSAHYGYGLAFIFWRISDNSTSQEHWDKIIYNLKWTQRSTCGQRSSTLGRCLGCYYIPHHHKMMKWCVESTTKVSVCRWYLERMGCYPPGNIIYPKSMTIIKEIYKFGN